MLSDYWPFWFNVTLLNSFYRLTSTWSVLCLILLHSPITVEATVTLVSSTKREAQHQQHEETIQWHRQGFGRCVEIDCDWEVTQLQGTFSSGDSFECFE